MNNFNTQNQKRVIKIQGVNNQELSTSTSRMRFNEDTQAEIHSQREFLKSSHTSKRSTILTKSNLNLLSQSQYNDEEGLNKSAVWAGSKISQKSLIMSQRTTITAQKDETSVTVRSKKSKLSRKLFDAILN